MGRPPIQSSLTKYKLAYTRRGNAEAVVEHDEGECMSKVGRPVAASEIGLTEEQWDLNLDSEAPLTEIADQVLGIEHASVHWGQAMITLADWKMGRCADDASLTT